MIGWTFFAIYVAGWLIAARKFWAYIGEEIQKDNIPKPLDRCVVAVGALFWPIYVGLTIIGYVATWTPKENRG